MKIFASLPCFIDEDQSSLTELVLVKNSVNVKVPLCFNLFGSSIKLDPAFSKCTTEPATFVGHLLGFYGSLSSCKFLVGKGLS